jgi:hypothetical protein
MKTITKTIDLYTYNELSKEAKEKARENFREACADYEWWEFIYKDAENVGITIKLFDLYRRNIEIQFESSAKDTALKILREHGATCDTYDEARKYIKARGEEKKLKKEEKK